PPHVRRWVAHRQPAAGSGDVDGGDVGGGGVGGGGAAPGGHGDDTAAPTDAPPGDPPPDRDASRDERVARMRGGLIELDRWLDDRVRTGLADPSLARYATWDELAA